MCNGKQRNNGDGILLAFLVGLVLILMYLMVAGCNDAVISEKDTVPAAKRPVYLTEQDRRMVAGYLYRQRMDSIVDEHWRQVMELYQHKNQP